MEDARILYFLEFLPRVHAAQVTIADSHPGNLIFQSNAVYSQEKHDACAEGLCKWAGPELLLSSYLHLKIVPGEGVHVRFKVKGGSSQEEGGIAKFAQDEFSNGTENCILDIKCGFCSSTLNRHYNPFKRILPLPSDAWTEFSGNVFCHAHSDSGLSSSSLLPREGDCLVSDSLLLLRKSALDFNHVTIKGGNKSGEGIVQQLVACMRCGCCLGEAVTMEGGDTVKDPEEGVLQLLRANLLLEKGSSPVERPLQRPGTEDYLARKLYSTSKSRGSYHFIVQDGAKRTYLYLRLFNVVSRVICNSCPTGSTSLLAMFSGVSSATTLPPSTSLSSATTPPPSTGLSSTTTLPPSTSLSSATTLPPSTGVSSATTPPPSTGVSSATTLPPSTSLSSATTPPPSTSLSSATTPPPSTSLSSATTPPPSTSLSSATTPPPSTGLSSATTPPPSTGLSSATIPPPSTGLSSATTPPPLAKECKSLVLKLLYKNSFATEDAGAQWRGDSNVDSMELTTEECLYLTLLLADSNMAIPPSQRVANGFRVGFLQFAV